MERVLLSEDWGVDQSSKCRRSGSIHVPWLCSQSYIPWMLKRRRTFPEKLYLRAVMHRENLNISALQRIQDIKIPVPLWITVKEGQMNEWLSLTSVDETICHHVTRIRKKYYVVQTFTNKNFVFTNKNFMFRCYQKHFFW